MALNFPATPALNQKYGNYTWDGTKWVASGASGAQVATIAFCFDSYRSAYVNACLTFMSDLAIVGTFFVVPEYIGTDPVSSAIGTRLMHVDDLSIMLAKQWEIAAYTNVNMAQLYSTGDRYGCVTRFKVMDDKMRSWGFTPQTIGAMQRSWTTQLTEMCRGRFRVVRVLSNANFAHLPIAEPLYLADGGGDTLSLSGITTLADLKNLLDQCIAAKGIWAPVIHEVLPSGVVLPPEDPNYMYCVPYAILNDFMAYCKSKQDAGQLLITTLAKAVRG